jgi:hypothetical protein
VLAAGSKSTPDQVCAEIFVLSHEIASIEAEIALIASQVNWRILPGRRHASFIADWRRSLVHIKDCIRCLTGNMPTVSDIPLLFPPNASIDIV